MKVVESRKVANVLAEAAQVTRRKYLHAKLCLIAKIYLTCKLVPAMQM